MAKGWEGQQLSVDNQSDDKAWIEKYRLAFEISAVPMLLVAIDGTIVLVNADLNALFGYGDDGLMGQSVELLVPASFRDNHPNLRGDYQQAPTKRSMGAGRDLTGVTRSGEIIPLELGLQPVIEGGEKYALVTVIDIRARKALEGRLALAMDTAANAMVMVDEQARIVFVNKMANRTFGYEDGDLIGQPIELLVPKPFRKAHPIYTDRFMKNSSVRPMGTGRDLFACHRSGRKIPVEITLSPIFSTQEKLVMSTIVDLSERYAAQETLANKMELIAEKSEALAALNVELSQFAYSASHDLKAPLSSISGLLSFCQEDMEDQNHEEVKANLAEALDICRRSAEKVEGVLSIASVGLEEVVLEPVQLETIIKQSWAEVTNGFDHAVRLIIDLEHHDLVHTEKVVLSLIIENLLSNALRYRDISKAEPFIRISSQHNDHMLTITVFDNGLGIRADMQGFVFDMFRRIDERSGDGIGLTLVKKHIDRLGGMIDFSSKEGEGTEFRFTLPCGDGINEENTGGRC